MLVLQVAIVRSCLISHRAKQQLDPLCATSSLHGAGQVIIHACNVFSFFFFFPFTGCEDLCYYTGKWEKSGENWF